MTWQMASLLLLGGSTVLLFAGMPVAISFIAINLIGAFLFLGGDAGLHQVARNSVAAAINFSLTPIPLFILMGEVLFHTGLALKVIDGVERLIRQVPGRLACCCGRRRNGFLGDLGVDYCDDGDARFVDAAGDAVARIQSRPGNRPDHGDRRCRHAYPALRPHCSAR